MNTDLDRIAAENERMARQLADLRDKLIALRESDAELRFRYRTEPALRAEFDNEAAYLAYCRDQRRTATGVAFQRHLQRLS